MPLAIALHLIGATIWVGGMIFAHFALRPAALQLPPESRLALWSSTLSRFFLLVWISVVTVFVSGYWMIDFLGGFGSVGVHIHWMHGISVIMFVIFAFIYGIPFRQMRAALSRDDLTEAAQRLGTVRVLVTINLVLGTATLALAGAGKWVAL